MPSGNYWIFPQLHILHCLIFNGFHWPRALHKPHIYIELGTIFPSLSHTTLLQMNHMEKAWSKQTFSSSSSSSNNLPWRTPFISRKGRKLQNKDRTNLKWFVLNVNLRYNKYHSAASDFSIVFFLHTFRNCHGGGGDDFITELAYLNLRYGINSTWKLTTA